MSDVSTTETQTKDQPGKAALSTDVQKPPEKYQRVPKGEANQRTDGSSIVIGEVTDCSTSLEDYMKSPDLKPISEVEKTLLFKKEEPGESFESYKLQTKDQLGKTAPSSDVPNPPNKEEAKHRKADDLSYEVTDCSTSLEEKDIYMESQGQPLREDIKTLNFKKEEPEESFEKYTTTENGEGASKCNRSLKCMICNKEYHTRVGLYKHNKVNHPEQIGKASTLLCRE